MVTRSIVDAGPFVAMKNLIILIVAEKLKNINLWLDITIENDYDYINKQKQRPEQVHRQCGSESADHRLKVGTETDLDGMHLDS